MMTEGAAKGVEGEQEHCPPEGKKAVSVVVFHPHAQVVCVHLHVPQLLAQRGQLRMGEGV